MDVDSDSESNKLPRPRDSDNNSCDKNKTKDNNNKLKRERRERKVDWAGRHRDEDRQMGKGEVERGYSSMLALKATGNKTCQPLTIIES